MENLAQKIKAARRDLVWAQHIATQGQSSEQRERGKRNAEKLAAELKAMGAIETGVS